MIDQENNQNTLMTQQGDARATVPVINFKPQVSQADMQVPAGEKKETVGQRAGELVERAFEQAVVSQVSNNGDIQDELLKSAEQVVHSKTSAIKSQAEMEDKAIHFNNKKGACECFGYNETTTEKWAVSYMNIWHNIMTAIWVTVGMVTFAPITFVAKKIKVIFKASWVAILLAILIYFIVITSPIWGDWFTSWIASLVKPKELPVDEVPEIVDNITTGMQILRLYFTL